MQLQRHLVATALIALAGAALIVGPAATAAPPRSEHQRVIGHWTADRMRSAKSRDIVLDRSGRLVPQPAVTNSPGLSWPTAGSGLGGLVARASGRVYFEMGSNAYVCSGTVVNDARADRS